MGFVCKYIHLIFLKMQKYAIFANEIIKIYPLPNGKV